MSVPPHDPNPTVELGIFSLPELIFLAHVRDAKKTRGHCGWWKPREVSCRFELDRSAAVLPDCLSLCLPGYPPTSLGVCSPVLRHCLSTPTGAVRAAATTTAAWTLPLAKRRGISSKRLPTGLHRLSRECTTQKPSYSTRISRPGRSTRKWR